MNKIKVKSGTAADICRNLGIDEAMIKRAEKLIEELKELKKMKHNGQQNR